MAEKTSYVGIFAGQCLAAWLLGGIFVLAQMASPGLASAAEPGRGLIGDDGYPWRALGRLNLRGQGFCTGALVSPDVVLTAAHCLYNRRLGRWADADSIHFVAGYRGDKFAFHARAIRYATAPGFDPAIQVPRPEAASHDWALITLDAAAGPEIGYLGVARLDRLVRLPSAPVFTLAGYGRDRPYALAGHAGCRLLGWEAGAVLVRHDCRAVHGTSGAPIIAARGGQYLIYALHVGRAEVAGRTIGGAVPARVFFDAVAKATGRTVSRLDGVLAILPGGAGE